MLRTPSGTGSSKARQHRLRTSRVHDEKEKEDARPADCAILPSSRTDRGASSDGLRMTAAGEIVRVLAHTGARASW